MQPELPQELKAARIQLQAGVYEKGSPAFRAAASVLDILVTRHDRPRPRLPHRDGPQLLFHKLQPTRASV